MGGPEALRPTTHARTTALPTEKAPGDLALRGLEPLAAARRANRELASPLAQPVP